MFIPDFKKLRQDALKEFQGDHTPESVGDEIQVIIATTASKIAAIMLQNYHAELNEYLEKTRHS
ncbi:MAG: hypothetical protein LKI17_06335 [Megasphaera cerevisiae]|jgi:hypothetical protein|nr:hypothetical protein [Megasphaera cerevisiae]